MINMKKTTNETKPINEKKKKLFIFSEKKTKKNKKNKKNKKTLKNHIHQLENPIILIILNNSHSYLIFKS